MNRTCIFLLLAVQTLLFSACEKLLFEPDPADDPVSNFDALWRELDRGYSFFEFKNVNWDSIYHVYRGRVNSGTGTLALFNAMSDMLYTLRDGHVNLEAGFNRSRNWEWYLDHPDNYDANLIERNYLEDRQWYTGPLIHTIIDSIGYLRYGSFGQRFSESQLDLVVARFSPLKGIIIDVRSNGGGFSSMADLLASRFADQSRTAYFSVVKNGPGRNDFSAPVAVSIIPEGERQFTKPIILLTNRRSYSATTFFVAKMLALPHVRVVGDWTGGGAGTPVGGELPNGWTVRYSSTQTFLPDGFNIEHGTPPHIRIDMSEADRAQGKDSILERALMELR
jgi:hypothetical protein